jgi:predicted esterase
MTEEVFRNDEFTIKRMPVQSSSYHAVMEPTGTHESPPALLLVMHGYGQACKNFVKTFAPLIKHNVLVVAPQGLNQFYWSNHRPAFSWMTSFEREQTIQDNLAYMAQLYDTLAQEYSFDPKRVFPLGFSQGVAMAFRFASAGHITPCGVIACGGDLPPDVAENLGSFKKFPALIMHGKEDGIVPIIKSEACVESLSAHSFDVTSHFFDGEHNIPEAQVDVIGSWMQEQ